VGLWLFAAGLALMVGADMGLSSWDVLHDAIAGLSSLSFGGAIVVVSVAVVIVSAALGIKPGPGTVANMVLVGLFRDLHTEGVVARSLALNTGIAAIGFGTGLYIGAGLGAGPRDSLMLALSKQLSTTAGKARTVIELFVLIVGIILGGSAGIGSLIFALLIGRAIDISFALLGMNDVRRKRSRPLRCLIRAAVSRLRRAHFQSRDELDPTRAGECR
jgi:uncharacterized membrane protein YczE